MTLEQAKYWLDRRAARIRSIALLSHVLLAAGVGLIVFALFEFFVEGVAAWMAGGIALLGTLYVVITSAGTLKFDARQVTFAMNRAFPELNESADLIVAEKPLHSLEKLQLQKVLTSFSELSGKFRVPVLFGKSLAVFAAGIACLFINFRGMIADPGNHQIFSEIPQTIQRHKPAITSIKVKVTPPAYTNLPSRESSNPVLRIPENGLATWEIIFTNDVSRGWLVFSGKDSIHLNHQKDGYRASRRFAEQDFYQINWQAASGEIYHSDFYAIEVVRDAPPRIEVRNLPQFTELEPGGRSFVNLNATLTDDYGLSSAVVVATVSKGSGESVKFREERLEFDQKNIGGKTKDVSRTIDAKALGLDPGDELYFYVEALDHKKPAANVSRTETFFIVLRDTATQVAVADSGLGVDLMPEYFRSQRQIIIDTEKLLAEENKIRKQEFNSRSNELGFDQKTLRLKYGQFLGEEEEEGLAVEAANPGGEEEEDQDETDPLKKYGHQHDTENEHNLVEDRQKADEQDPLKKFTHQHGDGEEATFFVQSVKAKLKAALTLMWDAELHLRMFDPKKSLPYQYQILKLLKEISQDSRIYVHRTGFDPPPIKEEKRLTAELNEIFGSTRSSAATGIDHPAIRESLSEIEYLLNDGFARMNDEAKAKLREAGRELATEALEKPGRYLQSLTLLRRILERESDDEDLSVNLKVIRKDFWTVLPARPTSPSKRSQTVHALNEKLLHELDARPRE